MTAPGTLPKVAQDSRQVACDKIAQKVAVLQMWEENGIPEGAYVPASELQFRQWDDEDLRVERWASQSTLNKPWNTELKAEANRLIQALKAKQRVPEERRKTRKTQVARLSTRVQELERITARLASQYTIARDAAERFENAYRNEQRRVEELAADKAELLKELSALRTIPRISGRGESPPIKGPRGGAHRVPQLPRPAG